MKKGNKASGDLNNIGSQFAATLTADLVFGKVLNLPESIEILRRYNQNSAVLLLIFLKHLNENFYLDKEIGQQKWNYHVANFIHGFFEDDQKKRVVKIIGEHYDYFFPLSDQALLATIELAIASCAAESGCQLETIQERQSLIHIVLSFQALLFPATFEKQIKNAKTNLDITEIDSVEFVRNHLAHNYEKYNRLSVTRLYAFCFVPEISSRIDDWFKKIFDVDAKTYFKIACFLLGPAHKLNLEQPNLNDLLFVPEIFYNQIKEPERKQILKLMNTASTSIHEIGQKHEQNCTLTDFLYLSTRFLSHPILQLNKNCVCVSPALLTNKFLTGLPYLAVDMLKASLKRELTTDEVREIRSPLGRAFESYILFLLQLWFSNWDGTEIISPYDIIHVDGKNKAEKDFVILRGDTAFVFEVKSTVVPLNLRKSGAFDYIDQMVKVGAKQAIEAAIALRSGKAVRRDGKPITGIRYVVPCVITYDRIPLGVINSLSYEHHLKDNLGKNIFEENDGISPMQFFDIEFLESWESKFDLNPKYGAPFGYLINRARDARLRYRDVLDEQVKHPAPSEQLKPLNDLGNKAWEFIASFAKEWFLHQA